MVKYDTKEGKNLCVKIFTDLMTKKYRCQCVNKKDAFFYFQKLIKDILVYT